MNDKLRNFVINKSFVKGLSLIAIPWLVVFILRENGPMQYPSSSESLQLFLLLNIFFQLVSFIFGYLTSPISRFSSGSFCSKKWSSTNRWILYLLFVLGSAYILFSTLDFFFVKGASGLANVVEFREQEHLTGPRNSFIGLLNALFSATPALLAVSILSGLVTSRRQLYLFSLVSLLGIACTFLSGGRNSFFLSIGYLISYWLISKSGQFQVINSLVSKRNVYFALVVMIVLLIYSFEMFIERFELQGMDPIDILQHYNANYIVEFGTPPFKNDFLVSCYVAFLLFAFYLTHPLTYLDLYFQGIDYELFYGAYNFPVVYRVVDSVFGSTFFDTVARETIGVYLTLPGSLLLDFSYFGAIVSMSLIAFLFGFIYRRRECLSFKSQLICAQLLITILFAPFYSAFALGNGFSFMFIIILIYLLSAVRLKSK